jgi:N-acetylglutamate synthase-like GNAT family acetyltransferase
LISKLAASDFAEVLSVVNDAAEAYRGVIPLDCWHEPYMTAQELQEEVASGVQFYGYKENGALVGIMGIQRVKDVTLIRHAYVRTTQQRNGVGQKLLTHLTTLANTPQILVGTWTTAWWAVRFYKKNGFEIIPKESRAKLRQYWNIPDRQAENSVVLKIEKASGTF